MEKSMGISLMITFLVSGVAATALAWLVPSLNLDKMMATTAGLLGVGFTVFQGFRFRHSDQNDEEDNPIPVEVETENES